MPKREHSSGTLALRRLLRGFEHFRGSYFDGADHLYDELVREGQSPRALVIACSDSRSDPALMTEAQPGDLFVLRNVAALVPPYERAPGVPKSASAAIEFGVRALEVDHIIVLGHSYCGGIRFLAEQRHHPSDNFEFLGDWVATAAPALAEIEVSATEAGEAERLRLLEKAAVRLSVHNLMQFPWLRERAEAGRLAVHGWHFDIEHGVLHALQRDSGRFRPVAKGEIPAPACGCCEGLLRLVQ